MKPVNLTNGPRFDTRGLPEGYDPHKLYEYRLDILKAKSTGLQSFLFELIPLSLIKSVAFAIDPTAPYKVSASPITPANRTRYRQTASVLQKGRVRKSRYQLAIYQPPNYGLVSFCWQPFYESLLTADQEIYAFDIAQDPLPDISKDATKRTRLYGSDRGTLELFKGYIHSPPRTSERTYNSQTVYTGTYTNEPLCGEVGGTYNKLRKTNEVFRVKVSPFGATLSSGTVSTLRTSELANNRVQCQKLAFSMLKAVEPFAGDYTLFRNLVELRDVPRSVAQLRKTAEDLRKVYLSLRHSPKTRKVIYNLKGLSKDVPNEYLSYHFGWKQLYRDLNDLLALPEKASKKVNFLMRRSGKPTTLHSKRIVTSASGLGVSGFVYPLTDIDFNASLSHRIEREHEVRLAVNRTFDFPPINSVDFKRHVYAERIGIQPRITDVYNLVPWTWLLDWFTGLGNYIDLIETINSKDSGVINWGMISCVTKGKLITDLKYNTATTSELIQDNTTLSYQTVDTDKRHTSVYNFECHTRDDIATVLDLNLTSAPSTLTAYQMSILGALLAQRSKFRF